ncbi:MAG: ABC transporter permease [Bacillota bacterium]|jgi:NitT/TauT family transport system permease protein
MTTSSTSNNHKASKVKKRWRLLFAAVFWLAVWQIASMVIGEEIFLVSPWKVLVTLVHLAQQFDFWQTIAFSFSRIVLGFFLAMILGIGMAVISSQIIWFRVLLNPLTSIIKSTPVASFIILALIWISSTNLSVFISFMMVFPIIYINTLSGILNTDPKMLEMAQVFQMGMSKRILHIYLPDVMPFFVSACSVSLGICWKSGIAAEVIGLPTGSIGEKLYQAKIYLNTGELFAWTAVIICISILFEKVFLKLLQKLQNKLEGVSGSTTATSSTGGSDS